MDIFEIIVVYWWVILLLLFFLYGWISSLIADQRNKERIRVENFVAFEIRKNYGLNDDFFSAYEEKLAVIGFDNDQTTSHDFNQVSKITKYFTLGNCPVCGDGKLRKINGKYGEFIGCSNYPDCRFTNDPKDYRDYQRAQNKTQFIELMNMAYPKA